MLCRIACGLLHYAVYLKRYEIGYLRPVGAGRIGAICVVAVFLRLPELVNIVLQHFVDGCIAELRRQQFVRYTPYLFAACVKHGERGGCRLLAGEVHLYRHQVVAYAVVQLACHARAFVFKSFDVARCQLTLCVLPQFCKLHLALVAASALPHRVYCEYDADAHKCQQHNGEPETGVRPCRLALREGQLFLFRVILDIKFAQAFGFLLLVQTVAQLVAFQQCLVGKTVLAEACVCLVHVVVAVENHKRQVLDAVETEYAVEPGDGLPVLVVVHADGAFGLKIDQTGHRRLYARQQCGAFLAPFHGLIGAVQLVAGKHGVCRGPHRAVIIASLYGVLICQSLELQGLFGLAGSCQHRANGSVDLSLEAAVGALSGPSGACHGILRCLFLVGHVEVKRCQIDI